MKFNIAVSKNIFISGKVKMFKAGTYETTDVNEIKTLKNATGVNVLAKTKVESKTSNKV